MARFRFYLPKGWLGLLKLAEAVSSLGLPFFGSLAHTADSWVPVVLSEASGICLCAVVSALLKSSGITGLLIIFFLNNYLSPKL